jgi:hypothetical protein
MQIKAINKSLNELIEKRNELAVLSYSDPKYDDLEEVLHDLEDDFLDEYGDFFEKVLIDIHDKNFPESDVLSPIAYMAKKYVTKTAHPDGTIDYSIPAKEGVWVEAYALPNKNVRLVLLPNPPRFVMQIENGAQKEVWNAKDKVAS